MTKQGNSRKRKEGTVQIPDYFKLNKTASSSKRTRTDTGIETCILNVAEFRDWGIHEVAQFLDDKGFSDAAKVFKGM